MSLASRRTWSGPCGDRRRRRRRGRPESPCSESPEGRGRGHRESERRSAPGGCDPHPGCTRRLPSRSSAERGRPCAEPSSASWAWSCRRACRRRASAAPRATQGSSPSPSARLGPCARVDSRSALLLQLLQGKGVTTQQRLARGHAPANRPSMVANRSRARQTRETRIITSIWRDRRGICEVGIYTFETIVKRRQWNYSEVGPALAAESAGDRETWVEE